MPTFNATSLSQAFPNAVPVPPLLEAFGQWVSARPHGNVGYFDAVASEPLPEGLAKAPEHVDALRAKLGLFLALPDGSQLALWAHGDGPPAVVLLGSEGELKNVAPTLEAFLVALGQAGTDISELDDDDASDGRPALLGWLASRGVSEPDAKLRVPTFGTWFDSGGTTLELPATGGLGDARSLSADVDRFVGRHVAEGDVRLWLESLGLWPLPYFGTEGEVYVAEKARGFCLTFRRATEAKPAPWLSGCFFYAEGEDEYAAFQHELPLGITWKDDATSLVARLGAPTFEHKSKKTGRLLGHRWRANERNMVSASYDADGRVRHVYRGTLER